MKALILAAGAGRRLGDADEGLPKVLLRFGGRSLLERHLALLAEAGIDDVALVVGHRADAIEREVDRLGLAERVRLLPNPRYAEGSIVSLWSARALLREGSSVLLMDADVLYDRRLLSLLVEAPHPNCFLLDRNVEPGDEPQKLCIRDGHIVDLHKRPGAPHDWHGESIGFLRCSPAIAGKLASQTELYVAEGRTGVEHEEAIRDLIVAEPAGTFAYVDATGVPWIEIDFADDVTRARQEILPLLLA